MLRPLTQSRSRISFRNGVPTQPALSHTHFTIHLLMSRTTYNQHLPYGGG